MKKHRFNLMATLLALSIVGIGIITVSGVVTSGRSLLNQSLRRIEQGHESGAAMIYGWLEYQAGYIEAISADLAYMPNYFGDPEYLRPLLIDHVNKSDNPYADIYIGYPNGDCVFASVWTLPYPSYTRLWYIDAAANPDSYAITQPYSDSRTQRVCVSVSKAIVSNGNLIGVISADVFVDMIDEITNTIEIGADEGYVFVTDGDNIILVHDNVEYIPQEDDDFHKLDEVENGRYSELANLRDGAS
jgi:hypothetical protein